jgi:hypothetical protein
MVTGADILPTPLGGSPDFFVSTYRQLNGVPHKRRRVELLKRQRAGSAELCKKLSSSRALACSFALSALIPSAAWNTVHSEWHQMALWADHIRHSELAGIRSHMWEMI